MSTPSSRPWTFRLVAIALGVLAALILAEVLVRVLDLGPQVGVVFKQVFQLSDNPVLRYELRPGASEGPVQINSHGMRDQEYTKAKPAGTFRIACIGDSICFGAGTFAPGTYASCLEKYLNTYFAVEGQAFEALNFGVTGYNITQSAEALRARALEFEPDLVIYGYCLNDPQSYSFELESLRAQLTVAQDNYRSRLSEGGRRLAARSRLLALASYAMESGAASGQNADARLREPDWDSLSQNRYVQYFGRLHSEGDDWQRVETGLAALANTSKQNAMPVLVVTFPLFRDLANYGLAPVHEKVARAVQRQGLEPLDLLRLFAVADQLDPGGLYSDDLHPNAIGHAMAAMAMLQRLFDRGLLPVAQPTIEVMARGDTPEGRLAQTVLTILRATPNRPPPGG